MSFPKPPGGGTTTTKKKKGTGRPDTSIDSTDDLKAWNKDWQKLSLNDLLVDLGKSGYTISQPLYKELQDQYLQKEAETGQSFSMLTNPSAEATRAFDEGVESSRGGSAGSSQAASDAAQLARQLEAQRFQAEQDEITRQFQAEQNRIEAENRLRLQRLGDLTNLVGQFAGIQQKARDTLAGLQGDPFAFAAARQGLAPQGTTPMEGFRGELRSFGAQPLPQMVGADAPLSAIEQQIQGLSGQMQQPPQPPPIFGMAGGGMVGNQPQTVLVGERGPEVVVGQNFQVLPLTATGAQGYNSNTLLPGLSALYSGMGIGKVPTTATNPSAHPGFIIQGASPEQLGYKPRLLRNFQTGQIFYRTPQDTLEQFGTGTQFEQAGFNWNDIYNVNPVELESGRFGRVSGNLLQGIPSEQGNVQEPSAFGPLSSPIIEPVTGAILPAPFQAGAVLQRLRLTNPMFYQLALSAYQNAVGRRGDPNAALGYTQDAIESEYQQALPPGRESGIIGLR